MRNPSCGIRPNSCGILVAESCAVAELDFLQPSSCSSWDGCPAKLGDEDSRRQPRLGGGRRDEPSHRHSQSPGGFFWSKKKHARSDKMKSFYVYFVSYNKCTSTTEGVVIGWKIHRQGCPETTLSVVQSFSSGDLSFSRAPQSSPLDDKTWVAQDRGETLPRSITRTKPGDKS